MLKLGAAGEGEGGAKGMKAFMAAHGPPPGKTIQPVAGDAKLYQAAFERHEKLGGKLFG